MRFLADENFPLRSVALLREAGHDVLAVSERLPGVPDQTVLERAVAERQILLTFDRDYGELIFGKSLPVPPGVVYLRLVPRTPLEAGEVVLALCAAGGLELDERYTVVDPPRVRQRPLP